MMKMNIGQSIRHIVSGNFLSHEDTVSWLPFVFFIASLGLVYIANGYYAEGQIRKLNHLSEELKDLRSEYVISKADLMFVSKQSEVSKSAAIIGLKESIHPPKKISVN